jgi:hypothetical protein
MPLHHPHRRQQRRGRQTTPDVPACKQLGHLSVG